MDLLGWDETLFRNEQVFDPEFIPEILHREEQITDLALTLRPAVNGISPGNVLCVGPPSTGKTTVVKHILNALDEKGVTTVYLGCPALRTTYNVIAKIYEKVCGKIASQKGVPIFKLLDEIGESADLVITAFDDINFLSAKVLNEVLLTLLKGTVNVGIIAVAIDKSFIADLDPYVGSIFHFHEIDFPLYSYDEVRDILLWRVKHGFYEGVMDDDAFELVVELVARNGDIRYGLYLLRRAGILAEKRASRKVEVQDVLAAKEGEENVLMSKSISALNSDEREALKIIYSLDDEITTGDVYDIMKREVGLYYERFYEILDKLERLRFVDLVFGKKGRGRTRYIIRRYDRDVLMRALREM